MPCEPKGSVVVITGASSGIGRATALRFAEEGATVVLAARNAEALQEVARECEKLGGVALDVPTDVTDEAAVRELARKAIAHFDRIDVWVNNAAVTLLGRFEETPSEDWRRVIETNLFGYANGMRAVMPVFREQGHGVLINVGSAVVDFSQPYTSAYDVSKHGIRALSASMRQELLLEGADDIHVVTIMPPSIDTPLFQNAANYTGRRVRPIPPVYPPERVADAIVEAVRHPKREVFLTGMLRTVRPLANLAPGRTERLMAYATDKKHLGRRSAPPSSGNLFEPSATQTTVTGGWRRRYAAQNAAKTVSGGFLVFLLASVGALAFSLLGGARRTA